MDERTEEKQNSRQQDQRRLESGEITQEQLRQKNGKCSFPHAKLLNAKDVPLDSSQSQLVAFLSKWCMESTTETIPRPVLKRAPRSSLVRLAGFLQLHVEESWSHGRIARLIAWRISPKRRR